MEKGEHLNQSLDNIATFLRPALPFLNCNMNDFFTLNLWNTMLPDKLREDIEIAPDRETMLTECLKLAGTEPWTEDDPPPVYLKTPLPFEDLELDELVYQIRQLSLLNMNVSVPVDKIDFPDMEDWETLKKNCGLEERKFDSLMSLKKEHEVKIMSQFVARLVKHINIEKSKEVVTSEQSKGNERNMSDEASIIQLNGDENGIKHLIDLGSGKGYLSCFLTLLYRFNVLAIDSSSENTQGSKKWTDNVHVRISFLLYFI